MVHPMLPLSASSEKTTPVFGGGEARTVSENAAEWLSEPLLPARVSEYVPAAAELPTAIDTFELPEPLTDACAKLTVTPEGAPEALSATAPEKPLLAPTETVALAVLPAET